MIWNHVTKDLSAYVHGELTPDEARRIGEHLVGCRRCRHEYDEIRFGAEAVRELKIVSAPDSIWTDLEAALDARPDKKSWASALFPLPAFSYALAVLAIAAAIGFAVYRQQTPPATDTGWEVTRIDGAPAIGDQRIASRGRLKPGEWLTTDSSSRAQISVGQIGEVKIDPNSRVRLADASPGTHRLAIEVGRMEAFIWAPPRQFFVDTPSAVAVDLGCSYTLEVDRRGAGKLKVTLGWVAFEWKGRESFVPAGAVCLTRPDSGPGTPFFDDASTVFIDTLAEFDAARNDTEKMSALDALLPLARKRDGLTLWHLLSRTEGGARGRVYDRLTSLIPAPAGVTRRGVIDGDRGMLDSLWEPLELGDSSWWRLWKAPFPAPTARIETTTDNN
ncbi:MAG: zf-HC2 domain-containing protein [Blastocatellales bacterium]